MTKRFRVEVEVLLDSTSAGAIVSRARNEYNNGHGAFAVRGGREIRLSAVSHVPDLESALLQLFEAAVERQNWGEIEVVGYGCRSLE